MQELSLAGVLLHKAEDQRSELLQYIFEVTSCQSLISLDVSGNCLSSEEANLFASFLQTNRRVLAIGKYAVALQTNDSAIFGHQGIVQVGYLQQ